ncbi:DNA ligase-associated DEXH box helicase [Lewinellaceae bacterium SD302]|nr:DNA ligase-associated DEXH box helicase [Lewinellaceae bacterium SD302]
MPHKTKPKSPTRTALVKTGTEWFATQGWKPFPFQKKAWKSYLKGESGLVNAPTGSGKTYSLLIPIFLEFLWGHADNPAKKRNGLQAIWITPIRALTREIQSAAQRAANDLGLEWDIAIRSGDTSSSERTKQRKKPPELLITTPESLHLLLAGKDRDKTFGNLKCLVADEWHELIGTKRGVLVELALSKLRSLSPGMKTWGISATIGNLEEAKDILLGINATGTTIRADINKKIRIKTVLPDEIETFPWSGHLGIKLLEKVIPIIHASKTTLIFTNTRAQCEIWYQRLLDAEPDLAGAIAMHHGSIDRELRDWVEDALHTAALKAVVCTSSLDLGVDFRPVETIVQIGSPKGVARFLQRAGRSGHQPGATSVIHFVPTNSLEIIEAAALRFAFQQQSIEAREPYFRSFDVLVQYLVTLAVGGDGFATLKTKEEIRQTFSFSSITDEEFQWCIDFITHGGNSLGAYDEYHKVVLVQPDEENGLAAPRYQIANRRMATIHRLGIGAIVSMTSLRVKYLRGGYIGNVEEYFLAQLKPGDTFWFAGRSLKLVKITGTEALVKKSGAKKGKIPSWQGGRMSLSNKLSEHLRATIDLLHHGRYVNDELASLEPLVEIQQERSAVPNKDQFLIEYFEDREGYHLVMYPYEGRAVHEGLSALIAYRLGQITPISFTIAMNDYGFELLSDLPIPIEEALGSDLFNTNELTQDIQASVNATELARRRFRDIAAIAGLVFKGFPGKWKKEKHLQSSSALFFDVFSQYEPDNLLLQQAYEEVMTFQLQEDRLMQALDRINSQYWLYKNPAKATPFSFSLIVDRLREKMSSEKLADRVKRMKLNLVK